jgi:hypothetical protein
VDASLPIIYSRSVPGAVSAHRLRAGPRVLALLVAIGCLSVLVLSAWLPPSPTGVGSHRALGLNSCQFLDSTGLPCPSCGMTTSFTWFARGNLAASIYVQPMGAALAAIAAGCVWGGLYVALTGRPVYRLLRLMPGRYYLLPLLALGVLAWGWKILIHLTGRDGW